MEQKFPENAPARLRYDLAEDCVKFLNERTGATFVSTPAMLHEIASRLHEVGNDVEAVKGMLERQVRLWKDNTRMKNFLRPATLFDEKKFSDYFGQRALPVPSADTGARAKELEELIAKSPANRESVFHTASASDEDRKQLKAWRRDLADLAQSKRLDRGQ
jgi:uncharacterized phage protein (TIGR02220 family)